VTRSLAAAAEGLTADDLTRIKGIKTILNAQLHDHGIFSYQQIAQWDAEDMLAFGRAAGVQEPHRQGRLAESKPAPCTRPRIQVRPVVMK